MSNQIQILIFVLFLGALPLLATPTFGDLAVLLAKGYFQQYVDEDASLEECVGFLNQQGICFSVFDLMDRNAVVKKEDFAKSVWQSRLLFLGEAELENGCVKRPLGIGSWVDYCILNDIDLENLWRGFMERVSEQSLPEVVRFFEKGS